MSKMRCHYEVLEVPMDASTEELTKSYRRLARTWHPGILDFYYHI